MAKITVSQLATAVGGTVIGDPARLISACNTLLDASPEQVSLYHNAKYAKELESTRAGCVILAPGAAAAAKRAPGAPPLTAIETKNIYYAWQQAMVLLMGQRPHPAVPDGQPGRGQGGEGGPAASGGSGGSEGSGGGISRLASIHPTAKLGHNLQIHPFAIIGENVTIGDNAIVYPHVVVTQNSRIGNDCILFPRVTIYEDCTIGNRCQINAGTVIGSDGFAYAQAHGLHHKMPQRGALVIEDDVEIGSNSIVERGALKPTLIERGTKIGSLVIIGHNCRIGPDNIIISGTCIAGSTTTGKYVVIAGQVGIAGHLNIPDFVKIGAQAGVMTDPEPNTEIVGSPAIEASRMKRIVLQQLQLPELAKRVKEIEKKLAKMESSSSN